MKKEILANARFAFRADTLTRWQTLNSVLKKGEPSIIVGLNEIGDGLENETERVKFGDGIHNWVDLPWWKGAKGDDYILTEADKQEIADLIGSQSVDLENYYTKQETEDLLAKGVGAVDQRIDIVEVQIGDIETALDNIIVIQESLMGGDAI